MCFLFRQPVRSLESFPAISPPSGELAPPQLSPSGIGGGAQRRNPPKGGFARRAGGRRRLAPIRYRPPPWRRSSTATPSPRRCATGWPARRRSSSRRTGHVPGLVTSWWVRIRPRRCTSGARASAAARSGMASFHEPLPATASQDEVLDAVDRWNADDRVDGILVQAAAARRASTSSRCSTDRPGQGRRRLPPAERRPAGARTSPRCAPCTPAGVMELLRRHGHPGRRAPTRWSLAARTSSASRWRCCCCTRAPP